jgi:hypothetical protein
METLPCCWLMTRRGDNLCAEPLPAVSSTRRFFLYFAQVPLPPPVPSPHLPGVELHFSEGDGRLVAVSLPREFLADAPLKITFSYDDEVDMLAIRLLDYAQLRSEPIFGDTVWPGLDLENQQASDGCQRAVGFEVTGASSLLAGCLAIQNE